jgi:HAD superfamily hydrolase (TIGR01509 family)
MNASTNGSANCSAVLFDLDGTLINSLDSFLFSAKTALLEFGIEPPPDCELKEYVKKPFDSFVSVLAKNIGAKERENLVKRYIQVYSSKGFLLAKPMDSAQKVVEKLSLAGKKLGIVTSRMLLQASIIPTLEHLGFSKYIKVVVTSAEVIRPKPEPFQHLLALKRLGENAKQALSVGDSPEDILGAKSAGIRAVAYTRGFYNKRELLNYQPDVIIGDLKRVLDLAKVD